MSSKNKQVIPDNDVRKILVKKIRDLYSLGWNYEEISELLWVSKTTVSHAIKGRAKKEVVSNIKK